MAREGSQNGQKPKNKNYEKIIVFCQPLQKSTNVLGNSPDCAQNLIFYGIPWPSIHRGLAALRAASPYRQGVLRLGTPLSETIGRSLGLLQALPEGRTACSAARPSGGSP